MLNEHHTLTISTCEVGLPHPVWQTCV